MKFKEWYSINEKWDPNFSDRDFGTAIATIVPLPDGILKDGSRMETYVHDKDTLYTFVFNANNDISHFMLGTLDNPMGDDVYPVVNNRKEMAIKSHPDYEKSHSNYSGVEPIKPPFKGYNGPYNIPKRFNMTDFNEPGSFAGIRTSKNWTLN